MYCIKLKNYLNLLQLLIIYVRISNVFKDITLWPISQEVKTSPSHGEDKGSIPL